MSNAESAIKRIDEEVEKRARLPKLLRQKKNEESAKDRRIQQRFRANAFRAIMIIEDAIGIPRGSAKEYDKKFMADRKIMRSKNRYGWFVGGKEN